MSEHYLVVLNNLHAPHHESGHVFDVTRIVFRLSDPTAAGHEVEIDLAGFQVPPGSIAEFDYARDDHGFEVVSRALAYQLSAFNTRRLARSDSLVLVANSLFVWKKRVYVDKNWAYDVDVARLSHESGACIWNGKRPRPFLDSREQIAPPMQQLSESAIKRMRSVILSWAQPWGLP